VLSLIETTGGATVLGHQDAAAVVIDGKPTTKEHFGFTDGFGNPDYLGVERSSQPGQGKLTKDGTWAAARHRRTPARLCRRSRRTPVAPLPHIFAANGTFMVYRKLHQNVAAFRSYLDEHSPHYAGGREKLAAKFVGRWRDGTPSSSPRIPMLRSRKTRTRAQTLPTLETPQEAAAPSALISAA
jgi:deferrochelatase/peroxidase EfeB